MLIIRTLNPVNDNYCSFFQTSAPPLRLWGTLFRQTFDITGVRLKMLEHLITYLHSEVPLKFRLLLAFCFSATFIIKTLLTLMLST